MTNAAVTSGLIAANAICLATAAASGVAPLLDYIQNGASVGAIMGIFLWREVRRAERYEKLYDEERKKRSAAENKCSNCIFVKKANEAFLNEHKE